MLIRLLLLTVVLALGGCSRYGILEAKDHHAAYPRGEADSAVTVYGFNHYRDFSKHNGMLRILEIEGHRIPTFPLIGGQGAYSVSLAPGTRQIKVLYVYSYDRIDYYSYHTYTLNLREGFGYFLSVAFRGPGDDLWFDVEEIPLKETQAELRI